MHRVKQTKFGFEEGNCFAACIASLLELPIEEVPNFCTNKEWQLETNRWLSKFGLCFWDFTWGNGQQIDKPILCILTGPSPRDKEKLHCVVGKLVMDELNFLTPYYIHDPHPSNDMLLSVTIVGFLIKLFDDTITGQ